MAKLPDNPQTRLERYLARLAGQDVTIPDTPITRIECYLAYLIENGGGAAAPSAGAHNGIFRGKNLGTSFTDAQADAIDAGTFDDIFIGDYWTKSGIIYRVAGLDYFYRMGDTPFEKHHVVIVPDTVVSNTKMNDSATTAGGYAGSSLRAGLASTGLERFTNLFGVGNVLQYRTRLVSAVGTDGAPSASTWEDGVIELMNETMLLGRGAYGTQARNGLNVGEKHGQLPLFALAPQHIRAGGSYWMQDVVSSTAFSYMNIGGMPYSASAVTSSGVRPYVCVGKGSV